MMRVDNKTYLKALIDSLSIMGNLKINSKFAEYINHNFGTVKDEKGVRQFTFKEGDRLPDVVEFLKGLYEKAV